MVFGENIEGKRLRSSIYEFNTVLNLLHLQIINRKKKKKEMELIGQVGKYIEKYI